MAPLPGPGLVMGELLALRPCKRCGGPGRRRDVYFREKIACSYFACDACLEELESARAEDRAIFEAILVLLVGPDASDRAKVTRAREVASAMMIAKQATERAIGRNPR